MHSHLDSSPLEGIAYEDSLPVSWRVLASLPSDSEQCRIDSDNLELLEALLILDEPVNDADDEQDSPEHLQHLRRLDVKLNLLTSLVRELLAATVTLPDERALQLGVKGLCVYDAGASSEPVSVGDVVKIRLFLDPSFPRPLQLCGHVLPGESDALTLAYCPLAEPVQDLFDKYIFRHHRRAIAMKRQRAGS